MVALRSNKSSPEVPWKDLDASSLTEPFNFKRLTESKPFWDLYTRPNLYLQKVETALNSKSLSREQILWIVLGLQRLDEWDLARIYIRAFSDNRDLLATSDKIELLKLPVQWSRWTRAKTDANTFFENWLHTYDDRLAAVFHDNIVNNEGEWQTFKSALTEELLDRLTSESVGEPLDSGLVNDIFLPVYVNPDGLEQNIWVLSEKLKGRHSYSLALKLFTYMRLDVLALYANLLCDKVEAHTLPETEFYYAFTQDYLLKSYCVWERDYRLKRFVRILLKARGGRTGFFQ